MPRFVLEYLEGGAGQEATLARERQAFAQWRAMPFTLADETCRDVSANILGRTAPLPLAIAPTGLNGIFKRNADIALAQATADAGIPFIQSTMSNSRMENVAAVPGLRHWWQLYVFGGDEIWQELVDRAERAGSKFATMDLIGLPWRITVGPRGLKNGVVELTSRRSGESEELAPEAAIEKLAAIYKGKGATCAFST